MDVKKIIRRGIEYALYGVPEYRTIANITYLKEGQRLKGKKVIITGGGRGLGYSMAEKFIKEGANVLIVGRTEQTLKDAAQKLGCYYLTLDVNKVEQFDDFFSRADELLGDVNCLVNNAGISLHEETFFDVTPQTFDEQINTNLKGCFFLTQHFLKKANLTHRNANVLFISSETGEMVDFRPYGLTKTAINSLVQGLAFLFAKDGYRINAVAPGITASDMTGLKSEGNIYYKWNINNRVYMPDEVAETACFLLSDASGCISGQIITCNNGKSLNARWK